MATLSEWRKLLALAFVNAVIGAAIGTLAAMHSATIGQAISIGIASTAILNALFAIAILARELPSR